MSITYAPEPTTVFPAAVGTLTTRPVWCDATLAAGPMDQPAFTPSRTLTLPNMPAAGGDILAAWTAYFGDRVGGLGTKQSGDRVIIPSGVWAFSGNLDIPDHGSNIEVVFGEVGNQCILRSSQLPVNGVVTNHSVRVLGAADIRLRGASKSTPGVIETSYVVGRNGLNQQGNTTLLLDPGTTGFLGQDLILRGGRAAGFFAYGADHYWLNRVVSAESLADAMHNTNGSNYGKFSDCTSRGAGDDGLAFVYYDGSALSTQSHHIEVYRHVIDTNGHGRGFANIGCSDIYADQVIVRGSAAAGVIVDREATTTGTAHASIANVLLQRFRVEGCNWSEQDHGSVFLRNGITNGTVTGVVMESFEIKDAAPNRQVVRTIGDGTANAVLTCTLTDFRMTGGTTTVATDQFGGNNTSRITRNGWANASTTTGVETIPPTLVINTPGRFAVVTGTLTGSTTDTSAMRNTQAVQFYAGDAGTKVSGTDQIGVATVEVKVGDTVIGTVSGGSLDTAKRGSQIWDTTQFANGPALLTLTATDKRGLAKIVTREISISNTTPGATSGLPAGSSTGGGTPTTTAGARKIERWNGTELVSDTVTATAAGALTTADRTKLDGIEDQATKNRTDAASDILLAAKVTRPSGGTDGQSILRSGTTGAVWGTPAVTAAQYGARRTFGADQVCAANTTTLLVLNANVFDIGSYSTKVDGSATTGIVAKQAGLHFLQVTSRLLTSTGGVADSSQTTSTSAGSFVVYVNGTTVGEFGFPRNNDYRPAGGFPINLAVGDEVTVGVYVSAQTIAYRGGPATSVALVRA